MTHIKVSKVLIQKGDKFMAVKESENGCWELPGGKIKETEDRFQAGQREIKEETGIEASGLKDVVRVEIEDRDIVECWILHTRDYKGDPKPEDEEINQVKWLSPQQFKDTDWHVDAGYTIPAMTHLQHYID